LFKTSLNHIWHLYAFLTCIVVHRNVHELFLLCRSW